MIKHNIQIYVNKVRIYQLWETDKNGTFLNSNVKHHTSLNLNDQEDDSSVESFFVHKMMIILFNSNKE